MATIFQTEIPSEFRGLYGTLWAEICPHLGVYDPVTPARVLLAPAHLGLDPEGVWDDRDALPGGGDAKIPSTLHQLTEPIDFEAVMATEGVGEAIEVQDGQFVVSEWVDQEVDVFVEIPNGETSGHDHRGRQDRGGNDETTTLYLGRYRANPTIDGYHTLHPVIPKKVWCRILLQRDRWTVVGRVRSASTKSPLSKFRVQAWDTDFIQDDPLGQGQTNDLGIFRIDYPGAAFRRRPLGGPREGTSGPDLYFVIEDRNGNELYREPRSRGRSSGRENVGPCACVELEVPFDSPIPLDAMAWSSIGRFPIPDDRSLRDFDSKGYALDGAIPCALYDQINLRGAIAYSPDQGPQGQGGFYDRQGRPIKYRFLVTEALSGAQNTAPVTQAVPRSAFTRVVGDTADLSKPRAVDRLFRGLKVGQIASRTLGKLINVYLRSVDLDADGWVDLNGAIRRIFNDPGLQERGPNEPPLFPKDMGSFSWLGFEDGMMRLNTQAMTTAVQRPTTIKAGDEVPPQELAKVQTFAIRFEVKSFGSNGVTFEMPGHGRQLNAVVMSNDGPIFRVETRKHLTGPPCQKLSGPIDLAYTVHHPHLEDVQLTVASKSGSYRVALKDPGRLPVENNTDPATSHLHNEALRLPARDDNGNPLESCTYEANLVIQRRLHTGGGRIRADSLDADFYLEV